MKSNNNSRTLYKLFGSLLVISLFGISSYSYAQNPANSVSQSEEACPVGLVSGLTLADEFGQVAADNTRCNTTRHDVKTLFAINQYGSDTRAYALPQMLNVYKDYTITHGMVPGRDFSMVAVVHGSGGKLLLKGNPHEQEVKDLMADGVTFYFCENTVRGFIRAGLLTQGAVAAGVIDGVKYVTAGLSAISDFQSLGYQYDEP